MPPNTRPPISSRIRASFEGKRSNSDASRPTAVSHGLANNDADSLRAALDQALNTDYFQHAIANHLAKLIKPSITTALDTLQPVVETVYAHEVLLKRTNESVENILQRLETVTEESPSTRTSWIDPVRSNPILPIQRFDRPDTAESEGPSTPRGVSYQPEDLTQVKTDISDLSRRVDISNSGLAEMADRIGAIHGSLTPTAQSLKSLQAWSNESKTNTAVMQAQLDQVKADIGLLIEVVPSDLAKCVKSIRTQVVGQDPPIMAAQSQRLEDLVSELGVLKGNLKGDQDANASAAIEALKSQVEAGITSSNAHFDDLTWRLSNISSSLEGHTQAFSDMKEQDASIDILKNTHRVNEAVSANGVRIEALESKHSEAHAELVKAVEALALGRVGGAATGAVKDESSNEPKSAAALHALAADLASLKENIEAGLTSNGDNLDNLGTKIDDVLTTLEAHREFQSTNLLGAIEKSNEMHASHTAALEAIQPRVTANAQGAESVALDSKIDQVRLTLGSLATELRTIKTHQPEAVAPVSGDSLEIHSHLANIIDTLGSHTSALDQIKATARSREIEVAPDSPAPELGEVHSHLNNIILTLDQHSNDFKELKERHVPVDSNTAPADVSKDLSTNITSIVSILEVHTGLLREIKECDVSEEILTLLHDCKDLYADHTAASTELKEADMSDEILTALHSSNDSHESHARALTELDAAIKAVALHPASESVTRTTGMGVEPKIDIIVLALEGQKAVLSEIKDQSTASNESHGAHTAMLEGIRDATRILKESRIDHSSVLTDIKDGIHGLHQLHAAQSTALQGIEDATATLNESHIAHAASLGQLQETANAANDLHATHVQALEELRAISMTTPAAEGDIHNITVLETQIAAIVATLDAQSSILAEIKAATTDAEVSAVVKHSQDLLTSHTSTLDSIKEGSSHAHLLQHIAALQGRLESNHTEHSTLIKDMHEDTKSSHASLTTALEAFAARGAAGAGASELTTDSVPSTELLEKLSILQTLTSRSSTTLAHLAAQFDINTTTLTTSINTLTDELKAEMDASGTEVANAVQVLEKEVKGIDVQSLSDAVGECAREMRGLSGGVEGLHGGLRDGVHLSEKRRGQLSEQLGRMRSAVPLMAREVNRAMQGEGEFVKVTDWAEERDTLAEDTPVAEEDVLALLEGSPPGHIEEGPIEADDAPLESDSVLANDDQKPPAEATHNESFITPINDLAEEETTTEPHNVVFANDVLEEPMSEPSAEEPVQEHPSERPSSVLDEPETPEVGAIPGSFNEEGDTALSPDGEAEKEPEFERQSEVEESVLHETTDQEPKPFNPTEEHYSAKPTIESSTDGDSGKQKPAIESSMEREAKLQAQGEHVHQAEQQADVSAPVHDYDSQAMSGSAHEVSQEADPGSSKDQEGGGLQEEGGIDRKTRFD